jgi:hypothetical protein
MINLLKKLYKLPYRINTSSEKKLNILHIIQSNKHKYVLYNVESDKVLLFEQDGIEILKKEVSDETVCLMGGSCFDTVVRNCLYQLRRYIEKQNETVITDYMVTVSDIRKEKIKEIFNDIL